jgi:hypothetical protein
MARKGWIVAAGLLALGALGACADDEESELPPRSPSSSRPGVPIGAIAGRSPGGAARGDRPAGLCDNGGPLGGDPRLPPVDGTSTGARIPGATLPSLPGDPSDRDPRRPFPGATLPALPGDEFDGNVAPAAPWPRGENLERDLLTRMMNDHARSLADAEACAESATDADVVAFCRYLAESRRGEMEWLSSWLGARLEGDFRGR